MAKNVTSVAVEFGVELDKFKKQLEQAGDLSTQAQREAVKMWIKEEKKRTKEAENAAKQRERAEKRAATEAAKAQKKAEEATRRAKEETQQLIRQIPGVGLLADAFDGFSEGGLKAKASTVALTGALVGTAAAVTTVTAAVGKAVAKFAELRAENEDTRKKIADLNQTTGLTSETLGALQLAGGPEFLAKFGEAAGEFGKRLSDAGRNTGELLPYLKSLGIEIRDQNGSLRETDAVVRDYIEALQKLPPSADRSAASTAGFGAAGRELMANLGSTNLATYIKLTKTFGADVGPEAMEATREWNVQTTALRGTLLGVVDRTSTLVLQGLDLSEVLYTLAVAALYVDAQLQSFGKNVRPFDIVREKMGEMAVPLAALGQHFPLLRVAMNQLTFGTQDAATAVDELKTSEANLDRARQDAAVQFGKSIAALNTRINALRDAAAEARDTTSDMFGPEATSAALSAEEQFMRETTKNRDERMRQAEEEWQQYLEQKREREYWDNWFEEQDRKREEERKRREEERARREQEAIAKREKALQDTFAAASMFSQQTGDLITNIGEHIAQQHGEHSAAYKRTMRDLFAAQKAVAISDIVIAGAVAIANAFKLDPIFGAIMTPIIAANSAVQIATVASEQPSFHTGGMIPSQTAAPDEVGITALSGEGVVSRRGMAALDAINRGDMMGGGSPVVVYGARVFDAVQGDLIQTPTSSISRAIRAKTRRRVGHRS